jgi:hypothetical protein
LKMSSVDRPSGGPQWHADLRSRGGKMRISFVKKDGGVSSGGSSPTGTTPVAASAPSSLGLDAERRYEEARARIFGSSEESAPSADVDPPLRNHASHVHNHGPPHRDGTSDFVGFSGRVGYDDDFARGAHIWAGSTPSAALSGGSTMQSYSQNPSAEPHLVQHPYFTPEVQSMLSALIFAPALGGIPSSHVPDS